jgi:hypothetical protein
VIRKLGVFLLYFFLAILSAWAAAALYFDLPIRALRIPAAIAYLMFVVALAFLTQKPVLAAGPCFAAFALVLVRWLSFPPSNNRAWQPDVAQTAWAEINGDKVTIHNYRNFEYRTETDYTPHWETKTVDVSKISGVDFFVTYWGSPWIAHAIVSFQVGEEDHVAMSIETRKEIGEEYSALRGFFRQYELIYVVADERDVVRVRTNYRAGESVYLYRTRTTPERARKLFLEYLHEINSLHKRPQWYNALTSNCTTNIGSRWAAAGGVAPSWDWRLLLNGRGDEMLYQRGNFAGDLPFPDLKARAVVNAVARTADQATDFSHLIRVGRPGF